LNSGSAADLGVSAAAFVCGKLRAELNARGGRADMKVRDLIAALSKADEDLEVLCYTEDGPLVSKGRLFRLLSIKSVEVLEGERCRVDDVPYVKMGNTEPSEKLTLLEVTSDF
jgi:hypothetical protein